MEGIDTTSSGYQIGYQIGSWLPLMALIILFLLLLSAVLKKQRNTPDI